MAIYSIAVCSAELAFNANGTTNIVYQKSTCFSRPELEVELKQCIIAVPIVNFT